MGVVLVLSGPSGSGKSSLINSVKDELGDYYFSISTTSREPRGQEVDGREYFFVSKDEFKKDIAEGAFLEYAKVHGNYYGTSLKNVYDALSENKMVLFDIDVQGHDSLKNILGDIMTSVFITPPTSQTLEKRLRTRATDDEDVIQKRLLQANDEIKKFMNMIILLLMMI